MENSNNVFHRALSKLLGEIFDGPPGQEAYILNPGDSGLLRQLDGISAATASARPAPGQSSIAAHVDHLHYGLSLLTRCAAGEENPWAEADWNASWLRNAGAWSSFLRRASCASSLIFTTLSANWRLPAPRAALRNCGGRASII